MIYYSDISHTEYPSDFFQGIQIQIVRNRSGIESSERRQNRHKRAAAADNVHPDAESGRGAGAQACAAQSPTYASPLQCALRVQRQYGPVAATQPRGRPGARPTARATRQHASS